MPNVVDCFVPGDISGVSERLVAVSKAQGSSDNISVLVVFLKEVDSIRRRGGGGGGMETSVFPDIYRKQNGRPATPYEEEDFGPETDVDSVDEVLLSPSIAAAKTLASQTSPLQGSSTLHYTSIGTQKNNLTKDLSVRSFPRAICHLPL